MEKMEKEGITEAAPAEKLNLLLENRIMDMRGELAKAQLIVGELITNINDAHMSYEEKERLDTKARIVSDYINETTAEMKQLVQLVEEL